MASGKTDMERVGLFSEAAYITIGDKYPKLHPYFLPINEQAHKDKQMLSTGSKYRSATQAGYFEKEFKRIMEKEAYSNLAEMRRHARNMSSKLKIGKEFIPNGYTKKLCGLGSYYGTFSGPINAFSPLQNSRGQYVPPGKNFVTNPGKKGTGYGYSNVLLGKPYEHNNDLYDRDRILYQQYSVYHKTAMKDGPFKLNLYPQNYFHKNPYTLDKPIKPREPKAEAKPFSQTLSFKPSSPGKRLGGCKAGTFEHYPQHSTDPYKVSKKREPIRNKFGQIFRPNASLKSRPISSVITKNLMRTVNVKNYRKIKRVTSY